MLTVLGMLGDEIREAESGGVEGVYQPPKRLHALGEDVAVGA